MGDSSGTAESGKGGRGGGSAVAKGGKGGAVSAKSGGNSAASGVGHVPASHPVTGTPLPKVARTGNVQRGGRKGR